MAALWLAGTHFVHGEIVISQIYGGGGNTGAPFRNDFVELFNRGTNTTNLTGWTVQYASSTSPIWQAVALGGDIGPGQFFLVQLNSGGSNGAPLPVPDATGNLSLAAGAGKIALTHSPSPLNGACPDLSNVADLAGYGPSASCHEGPAPAPAPGNATAAFRASGGCFDSDQNSIDFYLAAPAPRTRSSPLNPCSNQITPLPLHAIQGSAAQSTLAGWHITTTTNIVTGLRSEGFYMQSRDIEADADPGTSQAIFAFTPNGLPSAAEIGNAVVASGIVEEFASPNEPGRPGFTRLIHPTVTLISSGQPRPAPATLPASGLGPDSSVEQLEHLESMRVHVGSLTVVAPTEGFLNESNATAISDGVFHGVVTGVPRPLREPGIPFLDPLPPSAPPGVPRFDQNPETLRVDSNAQPGAPRLEVTAGAAVSNLVGVLTFEAGRWTILPDAGATPTVLGNKSAEAVPVTASDEFTVASFNLERFFDTADDPAKDETVLTPAAFAGRLNKASLAIRNILHSPDVLGIVEIENLATLQTLADRINSDSATVGQPNPGYQAWLEEGNDIGGIDVGVLVRTSRVAVVEVTQLGRTNTFTNPDDGLEDTLNDRPSLAIKATVTRARSARPLPVTIVVNHLRSLSGIDHPADGPRVRSKRRAQAEFLARFVQQHQTASPGESLILVGDFNAFPFSDGYVDVLGTIQGTPADASIVTLASPDLVNPDLHNLIHGLPAEKRYSFCFDGNAQALDHILVNSPALARLSRFAYARSNADFPESFRNNFNRPERLSDHDAPVAYFHSEMPFRWTAVSATESGSVALEWSGEPGRTVHIEGSAELVNWSHVTTAPTDETGRGFLDLTNSPARQFYRLVLP